MQGQFESTKRYRRSKRIQGGFESVRFRSKLTVLIQSLNIKKHIGGHFGVRNEHSRSISEFRWDNILKIIFHVSGNGEMANVKVYATPSVSFVELNLIHDKRPTQYEAFLIANAPEVTTSANVTTNVTESIGMFSEPESVDGAVNEILETEASVPVENAESEEVVVTETAVESAEYMEPVESRKRRQSAEETAAPEIESTPLPTSLASCVVAGAYPEPSNIKVYIGETLINDLDETMFVVSQNGQLFDAQVSVSAEVNGPEHSGNAIRCEVSDAENMYTSESVSEPLDIKCKYD